MHLLIAGTRGIPAAHGGFETFAQDLALFLVSRGHRVSVYCQADARSRMHEEIWHGVRCIHIPAGAGSAGTIWFDLRSTLHALRQNGVILTLGSNTGLLSYLLRLGNLPSVMNMDGIEWKRQKWSRLQRIWLWINERAGAQASTHLIADHPEIRRELEKHTSGAKITTIPYGADAIPAADPQLLRPLNLTPQGYYLVVARPEPENSILEIVQGHDRSGSRIPLVLLGNYNRKHNSYQRRIREAAHADVRFPGAIYDREIVQTLRFFAKAYLHGHRVGGTNPSLVESLGAGCAVIAHDNQFNRWVAGDSAAYFTSPADLADTLRRLDAHPENLLKMREGSRARHREEFRQDCTMAAYEALLLRIAGQTPPPAAHQQARPDHAEAAMSQLN